MAAVAVAVPEAEADASPDADAFYGQYQWPGYGAVGPYGAVSSTCWGCRPYHFYYGKRSADPEPHSALAVHPGVATSFVGPTVYGYPRLHYGKRDAEAHGVAGHPGLATSYVGRTIFGYPHLAPHYYGKREAHGAGVAVHPGRAVSHVGPTLFGYPSLHPLHHLGKRDAEPEPEAEASPDADAFYGHYGYGLAYGGYGYGFPGGYTHVSGLYGYHPYAYWG